MGFSRANLFGKHFEEYSVEAQKPFLVAMIEHERAVQELHDILNVDGLDAILIGPYDLSASMGLTGNFDHPEFCTTMMRIQSLANEKSIPSGIHVVEPSKEKLWQCIEDGSRFLAYSLDAVLLNSVASFARD